MKKLFLISLIVVLTGLIVFSLLKHEPSAIIEFNTDEPILPIEFTNDGKYLFLVTNSGVTLWDFRKRKLIRKFSEHSDFIDRVCISPNQKYFITGCSDGSVWIWDFESATCVKVMQFEKEISDVCVSNDSQILAVSTLKGNLKLWDLNSFEVIKDFGVFDKMIIDLDFSPRNDKICSAGNELKVVDISSLELTNSITNKNGYSAVSFDSDNSIYACLFTDEVLLYDLVSEDSQLIFEPENERALSWKYFSKDNVYMSSIVKESLGVGPRIETINLKTGEIFNIYFNGKSLFSDVCISPDNKLIATATYDGQISIYEIADFN